MENERVLELPAAAEPRTATVRLLLGIKLTIFLYGCLNINQELNFSAHYAGCLEKKYPLQHNLFVR